MRNKITILFFAISYSRAAFRAGMSGLKEKRLAATLSWVLLLLFSTGMGAQEENLEAFEINADTATTIPIPENNWQHLIEKEKLTLRQVRSKEYASQFRKMNYDDAPLATYWVRYKIKNNLPYPLSITIPESIDCDLYIGLSGKWDHFKNGNNVPWSRRDGLKRIKHVECTIPENSAITVYERLENVSGTVINNKIGIRDNVIKKYYIENDDYYFTTVTDSSFFGFLAFAALCNFFFFVINKEWVYFIYALTLLVSAVVFFRIPLFHMAFREHPHLFYKADAFLMALYTITMFLTTLLFLKVDQHHKRWYRVLLSGVGFIAIASVINSFFWSHDSIIGYQEFIGKALNFLVLAILVAIVAIIAVDLYYKRRAAKLFMVAITPFLVSSALQFLLSDKTPSWVHSFILTSVVWAVVIMSWSLFERFRALLHENMQQALSQERLAREKEEERNQLIAQQNERLEQQVAERTADLTKSLEDLKMTQSQLIQSEKMASLGELTAGIAHEIQNPLNFVNNFSDVSVELLQELKEELDKGELEEVAAIADDVSQNLEKIAYHGRRADGIVKGMLQHSRTSTGQKEPTDINALADEYLRLAYHGLRAKDKSFNAELITDLDPGLPKVNVIPQDIGRVLLNLFTNAFYATKEKSKELQQDTYKPALEVETKVVDGFIEVTVRDNGTGIPDAIKDKVMQPFFTTKPTGEGTGLGLSLSYDIVVKGHGGNIDIRSEHGKATTFIIKLPIQ